MYIWRKYGKGREMGDKNWLHEQGEWRDGGGLR